METFKVNSSDSKSFFWTLIVTIIILPPMLSFFFWAENYNLNIITINIGQIILVSWLIYIGYHVYISFLPRDSVNLTPIILSWEDLSSVKANLAKVDLVSVGRLNAKTSEYFLIKIGSLIILTGKGADIIFIPVLWPFTYKTMPVNPLIITVKFTVLTKDFDDKNPKELKHQDNPLSHQANHLFTVQSKFPIKNHEDTAFIEKNGGGYLEAVFQSITGLNGAIALLASKKTAKDIADERAEANKFLLEDWQETTGDFPRNLSKFLGFESPEFRLVSPLLAESINVLLLQKAEVIIKNAIKIKEGKNEKELEILRKQAIAKGNRAIGYSEADVDRAKILARDITAIDELSKKIGVQSTVLLKVLDKMPDILKNADLKAIMMSMPEGQNLLGEIMKIFTALKTVGPDLDQTAGKSS